MNNTNVVLFQNKNFSESIEFQIIKQENSWELIINTTDNNNNTNKFASLLQYKGCSNQENGVATI